MKPVQSPHQFIESGRWAKPNTPRGGVHPMRPITPVTSLNQRGVIWN